MRELVLMVGGFLLLQLLVSISTHLLFGKWRYRKGYRVGREEGHQAGHAAGYSEGFKDGFNHGDEWWIGTEREIDQARQRIWRGES